MKKRIIRIVSALLSLALSAPAVFAENASTHNFEAAWQEASSSQAYAYTCTTSSGSTKIGQMPAEPETKKLVELTLKALKRYRSTNKGVLLGGDKKVLVSTTKLNTLGILDAYSTQAITLDEAVAEMKKISKKTGQILIDGNMIYYKGSGAWNKFESADFAGKILEGAINEPIAWSYDKSSFSLKSSPSGTSGAALYTGKLSADKMVQFLTPFVGEESAKEQKPAATKLYITGDNHVKKHEAIAKVVVGGLSFTVKEKCEVKYKKPTISIPSSATSVDAQQGLKDIIDFLSAR